MFSGSISVVLLVVFVSQGQSTTTMIPRETSSAVSRSITTTTTTTTSTTTPTTKTTQGQTTTPVIPSATSSVVSQNSSVTIPPPTSTAITTPTTTPTATPLITYTVCILIVIIDSAWNEDYGNESSETYKNASKEYSSALEKLFEKHMHVKVLNVAFKNEAGKVFAEAKLRLVFNEEEDSRTISVIFITKVDSGKLSDNLQVIKGSGEVEDVGVSYKNYKAKEGECDKCDGAGGPFEIEGECVPDSKEFSCNGVEKKKTKKTEECTTYCSSTALTVSSLILAIGILLSYSFQ